MDHVPLSNVAEKPNYGVTDDVTTVAQDSSNRPTNGRTANKATGKNMVNLAISTLNHILIVAFTIYIIVKSFEKYYLFSWHPSCMTVGSFLLMSEAVMAISPDNILTSKLGRQQRVRLHWILQAIAAVLIFIGFLIIVINKNQANKPHFQTVHAILGLVTFILICLTSLGGVFALFSIKFRQIISPSSVKLMHNMLGIITFFIGALCLVMGLYSNWFDKFGYASKVAWRVIVIFSTFTTLEAPVKSAYFRIKNMYTRT